MRSRKIARPRASPGGDPNRESAAVGPPPTHATADLTWDQARRAILPLMRADDRASIVGITREYAYLIVVLSACTWVQGRWRAGDLPTYAFLPAAVVGAAAVAAGQHRLSGLAHDASHGVLFRGRLVNDLASDLLLMFPLLAYTQTYRAAHLGHHRWVNDPARDPDLVRLNTPTPLRFPMPKRRFWRRYVVDALWPPSALGYLLGRFKAANRPAVDGPEIHAPYRRRVAGCLRGAYWLVLLGAIQAAHAWPTFLAFWVAPLLTFYPLFMQLREVAHHANAPDDGDLTNSRVFRVHPLLHFAVFPHGQAFHLTHHLFAMVPGHKVAEADATLRRHPPYREQVVVCRGYFFRTRGTIGPSVLDLLAAESPRGREPHPRLDARVRSS